MQPLPPSDADALLLAWRSAATCPLWRLAGESPSVGLLESIRLDTVHEVIVRDIDGNAAGVLGLREVDDRTGRGFLSFAVPPAAAGVLGSFAREALETLDLRTVIVLVDEDMAHALTDLRPELALVGCLRGHTLIAAGRFVDRYIYELDAGAS